jgi:protein gp37
MNKTKIEWCSMTWNPVSGCYHNCPYCYARRIATRFGGASETDCNETVGTECQWLTEGTGITHDLTEPVYDVDRGHIAPYPFDFDPTFHRYRLSEPAQTKKPQRIFVCSMADLFGDWAPDEWIQEVFAACEKAPQHTYLFLTKNPKRYGRMLDNGLLPNKSNYWYGSTCTKDTDIFYVTKGNNYNWFVSIEPLLEPFREIAEKDMLTDWLIIGAESGNRKGKIIPEKIWVQDIAAQYKDAGVPVFMKESLRELMGSDFVQEYPAGLGAQ